MSWGVLASLIVAVTGLISSIWAIVRYYDKKQETKQNAHNTFVEETRQENQKQSQLIQTLLERVGNLETSIGEINNDLQAVHHQINTQSATIDDNEMSRLQTAIMDFADKLRSGYVPTLNNFNQIFHDYDKYKKLHGNSFIDSEMKYIKKKKEEFKFIDND